MTRATNESGFCTSRHNCFANMARLNSWIIRKPTPPSSLGKHIFSHFSQCIPLFWGFELHQNCAMALERFSQISSGNSKEDITYVGRASKIDLIRTSFPPFEKYLHIHPFTLYINLSLRKTKSFI